MPLNLRPFQIVTLVIFVVLAIISLILLSGYSPDRNETEALYGDRVEIWGSLNQTVFNDILDELRSTNRAYDVVTYQYIDPRSFDSEFVQALAEGYGPDLILVPSSELVSQRNRLIAVSYESFSLRAYRDRYVEGAEIFARPDGIYAFPVLVDPVVMYWNRDILASNGIARPPATWETIVNSIVPTVTRRDNARTIFQSALAMGEISNVLNAKPLLLSLALQSGSRMIVEEEGQYKLQLNETVNQNALPPLSATAQFYLNFSNPNNQLYSWNRAQPLDRNAFIAGDLALYFGFGSEYSVLVRQNPNLNFDISSIPQGTGARTLRTYGEFYGFAIPKASANQQGAFLVAQDLSAPNVALALANRLGMAPVERSTIEAMSDDPYQQVLYNAALIARGWLDPNPTETSAIFQAMIEDVSAGRKRLDESINDAVNRMRLAF